jgi:alkylhydroperoxidase family enzyme
LARQQGLTEDLIHEIANYRTSKTLTDREKAAIHLAEVLAGDHREASQELFDEARRYLTEGEIIDLCLRIVTFVGYGRLIHALGLEIGRTCPITRPGEVQPHPAK